MKPAVPAMITITLRLFLAIAGTFLLPGCAGVTLGSSQPANATERMMWSTYLLGTKAGAATGFIVVRNDSRKLPVMVTSKHALQSAVKDSVLLVVRVLDSKGEPMVAVLKLRGPSSFTRHPRQDVAAFPVEIPAEVNGVVSLPSFIHERALARRSDTLRAGHEVAFLGFPEVIPGTNGGFPVLRTGKVASYPARSLRDMQRFVIDVDVYAGDSGAPVFRMARAGNPALVGMITSRVGEKATDFAHFAVAVDSTAIRETLDLLDRSPSANTASLKHSKP